MRSRNEFENRLERIFLATGAKNDTALARILEIQPSSVAGARKRQLIPGLWIEKVARDFNVNAHWLLFGENRDQTAGSGPPPLPQGACYSQDVVYDVVETLEEYLLEKGHNLKPSVKAEVVRQLCQMVIEHEEGSIRPGAMLRLIRGALAANE